MNISFRLALSGTQTVSKSISFALETHSIENGNGQRTFIDQS